MRRKFILGTDWWTDCDDAVALRILTKFVKEGKIELLGIIVNACMEYSVSSVDGFLTLDGVKNIPIGLDQNATDFGGIPPYQKRLSLYASKYKCNKDAESAVLLYRRLLASAKEPIEIIEIGYMQAFTALLQSGPDSISDKKGIDLVREKVKKVWVMAGKWDEPSGRENNFCRNIRSREAACYFCKHCPVPITFLGYEIGSTVITGGELDKDDHLYKLLCDHNSENGRFSWDPMLTLLALIGDEHLAGYSTVKGYASVDSNSGENYFEENVSGPHQYVVKNFDDTYYKSLIDEIIKVKK